MSGEVKKPFALTTFAELDWVVRNNRPEVLEYPKYIEVRDLLSPLMAEGRRDEPIGPMLAELRFRERNRAALQSGAPLTDEEDAQIEAAMSACLEALAAQQEEWTDREAAELFLSRYPAMGERVAMGEMVNELARWAAVVMGEKLLERSGFQVEGCGGEQHRD